MARGDVRSRLILEAQRRGEHAFRSTQSDLQKLGATAQRVRGFLIGIGAALAAREYVDFADRARTLSNRLRLVTDSTRELTYVQEQLFEISQDTRSSFESTVELYSRVARSSDELGLSHERLLGITETINKAIQVSGATAIEAQAGLVQFSQGLASGALRGDELRSVLEQMPRLARAIAEGMGVTVGRLRELGSEGALSAQTVLDALEGQADVIASEFEKLTPTVGQSITQLGNSMLNFIGRVDEASGASKLLATAIESVSGAIDRLVESEPDKHIRRLRQELEAIENAAVNSIPLFSPPGLRDAEARLERFLAIRKELEFYEAEPIVIRIKRIDPTSLLKEINAADFIIPLPAKVFLERPDIAIPDLLTELQDQLRPAFEQVREFTLTREEIEREAIQRRLEILANAREIELIDQQRFEELSAEVARRGQEQLTQIALDGMTRRQRFEEMSARERAQTVIGSLVQMTAGVATTNRTLFNVNKAAAIANAVVNTAQGVTKALSAYPPPLSFVMAAAQAAAGAAQIQAIRATSFGGGTTPSVAGSVPTLESQPVATQAGLPELSAGRSGARVEITINGNVIGEGGKRELGEYITELLREHTELTDDVIITERSRNAANLRGD